MVDACCIQFSLLLRTPEAAKRPTAQGCANVLWALATMKLLPTSTSLINACCERFSNLMKSSEAAKRPTAQDVANLLWALAVLEHVPSANRFLDLCCELFHTLVVNAKAQNVANVLWALSKLKHAPNDEVAMTMITKTVALCHIPGQQPTVQGISNVLLACADLRLDVKQAHVDTLVSHLFSLDQEQANHQVYVNAAMSLAVMGLLRNETFGLLLSGLSNSLLVVLLGQLALWD